MIGRGWLPSVPAGLEARDAGCTARLLRPICWALAPPRAQVDLTTDPAVPSLRTSGGQVVPILSFNQPAGAALVHSLGSVLSTLEPAASEGDEQSSQAVKVTP